MTCTNNDSADQVAPLKVTRPSSHPSKRAPSLSSASESSSYILEQQSATENITLRTFREGLDEFNELLSRYILMQSKRMDFAKSLRQALELLQEREEYLTDDQMAAFMDLFRSNPSRVEVYLVLKDDVRKAWIRLLLKQEA